MRVRGGLVYLAGSLLIGSLSVNTAWSQDVDWIRQFGGQPVADACLDEFEGVTSVAANISSVYVGGITSGVLPGQSYSGFFCRDYFLRKYDANGNEVWTQTFHQSGYFVRLAVALDSSGVYVTGYPGFLRKFDFNGNVLWTQNWSGWGNDVATGLQHVYVVGAEGGAEFLRVFDKNGNQLWTKSISNNGSVRAFAVDAHSSGIFVAGSTDGTFAGQTATGPSTRDAFLMKFDHGGTQVGIRQFNVGFDFGITSDSEAKSVSVDHSGVYVCGENFLRKYDLSDLTTPPLWQEHFNCRSVSSNQSGVYVAEWTIFTPRDVVAMYDHNGSLIWEHQVAHSVYDSAAHYDVSALYEQGIPGTSQEGLHTALYVGGSTSGELPGQQATGRTDVWWAKDAYVMKYELQAASSPSRRDVFQWLICKPTCEPFGRFGCDRVVLRCYVLPIIIIFLPIIIITLSIWFFWFRRRFPASR